MKRRPTWRTSGQNQNVYADAVLGYFAFRKPADEMGRHFSLGFERAAKCRSEIKRFARALEARLARVGMERAATDDPITGRASLIEVIGIVTKFKCLGLIVPDWWRFCLSPTLTAELLLVLRNLNKKVYEASSGQELTAQERRWEAVLAGVSEIDRRRAKLAIAALRRAGARLMHASKIGRPQLGATDEEQETLKRIRELRRKPARRARMPYRAVAAKLDAEGLRTREGKPWQAGTVRKIVRAKWPHLA